MATKHQKQTLLSNKLIVGVVAVLALLAIVQLAFNVYVWRQVINRDDGRIASLILDAVDNLGSPVPADAQSGKLYVAEERLVLPPATVDLQKMTYTRFSAQDNLPAELTFTARVLTADSRSGINNAASSNLSAKDKSSKIFELVPELQACTRGVHLVFGNLEDTNNLIDKGTKKLADGRTVHFYIESGCKADFEPLLALLRQVESY